MRQMMLFNRQLNKPAQDKRIHTVANRIATIAPTYSFSLNEATSTSLTPVCDASLGRPYHWTATSWSRLQYRACPSPSGLMHGNCMALSPAIITILI